MPRRSSSKTGFDWTDLFTKNLVFILGFVGTLIAFYYSTRNTLDNHEKQFVEIAKKFDNFNESLKGSTDLTKHNFDEWMKVNDKNTREERDIRDKMRDQFTTLFTQLSQSSIATKVQVDSITKNVDTIQNKLDGISTIQKENQLIRRERK